MDQKFRCHQNLLALLTIILDFDICGVEISMIALLDGLLVTSCYMITKENFQSIVQIALLVFNRSMVLRGMFKHSCVRYLQILMTVFLITNVGVTILYCTTRNLIHFIFLIKKKFPRSCFTLENNASSCLCVHLSSVLN